MTHIPQPIAPMNPAGLDEIAEELFKETPAGNIFKGNTTARIPDPEHWLFLEGRQHGSYEYPDLYASLHRLSLTPSVQQAAQQLNLTVANTALQKDGHLADYIGNIQHKPAMDLVIGAGYCPLPPRLFVDFLNEIRAGLGSKNKKVYNAQGNPIPHDLLQAVWDDITKVQNPYRGEWFDAAFTEKKKDWSITYHKFNAAGKLELVTEPLDPDTLMEDKTPGISLEDWLNNPTPQGLPRKDAQPGSLCYWFPRAGYVSRFWAVSDWVGLNCVGGPQDSGSGLGVRMCAAGAPKT